MNCTEDGCSRWLPVLPDFGALQAAVGQVVEWVQGAISSAIAKQVAQRVLTDQRTLRTSATVARQLANQRGFITVQAITTAIANGVRTSDPQGVAGQFMYTAEASFNDSVGTLEVLVNEQTNTIVHVLFRSQ